MVRSRIPSRSRNIKRSHIRRTRVRPRTKRRGTKRKTKRRGTKRKTKRRGTKRSRTKLRGGSHSAASGSSVELLPDNKLYLELLSLFPSVPPSVPEDAPPPPLPPSPSRIYWKVKDWFENPVRQHIKATGRVDNLENKYYRVAGVEDIMYHMKREDLRKHYIDKLNPPGTLYSHTERPPLSWGLLQDINALIYNTMDPRIWKEVLATDCVAKAPTVCVAAAAADVEPRRAS